ncbi:MAG TPA: V-type ATP synthase subunit D [Candidatus Brocadiia bacterium]|nr:V-type ATP synthase subunit D [Planctomycetota bacterium]MDO8094355.1 V-type ATP synthase subunit D [Candidatus Brocadiales bacterium]
MEQVSPTRMNLLQRKAQIKLALQGVELLKNKRDALLKEFMGEVQPLLSVRNEAQKELRKAVDALIMSLAIDGSEKVESAAFAYAEDLTIKMEERNIWGIKIPHVKTEGAMRSPFERGYATDTSARIDETASAFKMVIDLIIKMAPIEIKLKRLGQEIRKTSRRVNALEQILIPNLTREMRFIRDTLEERAREDVFRLKRLKGHEKT